MHFNSFNFFLFCVLITQIQYLTDGKLETKKCVDSSKYCKSWAKEGKCEKYGILKRCPKSCNACDMPQLSDDFETSLKHTKFVMYLFGIIMITGVIIGIVKMLTLGQICRSKGTLKGKVAVITGATSGIGLDTAIHLAARGAHVIIGCRNLTRGFQTAKYISNQTKQKKVEVKKLDLSNFDSVRDFADDIISENEKIDILINNAAVISTKNRKITRNGHEETFQVNYLSHFLLTNLLLEKLQEGKSARVINIVDKAFHSGKIDFADLCSKTFYNNVKAYNNSKLALMIFTQELSDRLRENTVTINSANPGTAFTNLYKNVFPYNFKLFWPIISFYSYLFWNSTSMAAETIYYCALEKDLIDVTGKYFENCSQKSICHHDPKIAKKLWELSEKLVSQKYSSITDEIYNEHIHETDCSRSPRNAELDKKNQ